MHALFQTQELSGNRSIWTNTVSSIASKRSSAIPGKVQKSNICSTTGMISDVDKMSSLMESSAIIDHQICQISKAIDVCRTIEKFASGWERIQLEKLFILASKYLITALCKA